jgi:2-amino-4-hydroxy-6-hydroxymethyldihydropteridine diphosphokinase
VQILLGLGGNLGDVQFAFAVAAEAVSRRFRVLTCSSLWRTAPVGPPQPDFLNAALLVEVDVDALRLLAFCDSLETAAGRRRAVGLRHGPRTLDLDLLLARGLVMESPALTLPHPRLAGRRFALLPATEVAPEWDHPRLHRPLAELTASVSDEGQVCRRAGPFPPFGPGRPV